MSDSRPVALVTGGSRGAGAGIAHALGSHGCIVYVTGRTESTGESALAGTIHETARRVTSGTGIAVRWTTPTTIRVKALFDRIEREQGRLDILVNNAAIIRDDMMGRTKFWEEPLNVIDTLDVGLRSSYVATVYAAPLMLPRRHGLVVSPRRRGGPLRVRAAYGVPKAGTDKMAADMAFDWRSSTSRAVSIWMGSLLTDRVRAIIASNPEKFGRILDTAGDPGELTGHVIWALYNDPDLMELTGQTLIGAELAVKYGITDEDDRQPPSYRGHVRRPSEPAIPARRAVAQISTWKWCAEMRRRCRM